MIATMQESARVGLVTVICGAGQSHVRGRSGSMFAFDVKESSRPRSGRAQLLVSRRAYVERYKAG